jgi:hypothetical protein
VKVTDELDVGFDGLLSIVVTGGWVSAVHV